MNPMDTITMQRSEFAVYERAIESAKAQIAQLIKERDAARSVVAITILRCTVESGDWESVYINGQQAEQGHSVPLDHFLRSDVTVQELKAAGIELEYHTREYTDDAVEEMGANFPATVEELPQEGITHAT